MRKLTILKWNHLWLATWGGAALAVGPFVSNEFDLTRSFQFGFDAYGRNVLKLSLAATYQSMLFAAVITAFSIALSAIVGSLLSLSEGTFRYAGSRILDFLLAFPSLLVALAVAAIYGPGPLTLTLSLAVSILPSLCRLMYLRSDELLREGYVQASISIGAGTRHLIVRHLWPSLLHLAWIKLPNLFAQIILAEATLGFLGLAEARDTPTWGALLIQARDSIFEAPHIAASAGVPLILTVLSLQLSFSQSQAE